MRWLVDGVCKTGRASRLMRKARVAKLKIQRTLQAVCCSRRPLERYSWHQR